MAKRGAKRGYERIVISGGATCSTGEFIDRFLQSKGFALTPSNRELVRVMIRKYPGRRPIGAPELAEYLSRLL